MKLVYTFLALTFSCSVFPFGSAVQFSAELKSAEPVQQALPVVSPLVVKKELTSLWTINRETIETQKRVIQTYLKRNSVQRVLVRTALLSAAAIAVAYYYRNYYCTPATTAALPGTEPISVDKLTLAQVKEMAVQNQVAVARLENAINTTKATVEQSIADKFKVPVKEVSEGVLASMAQKGKHVASGTYNFIHGVGFYFYQNLPAVIAGGFVNLLVFRDLPTLLDGAKYLIVRPIKKINHPLTLEWFLVTQIKVEKARYRLDIERPYPGENNENVGTRLNYDKFFSGAHRTASLLPLASDQSELDHYTKTFVTSFNFLSRQIARIIAFCEMRTDVVMKQNKTCGRHLKEETDYVLGLSCKMAKECSDLLGAKESHTKIPALIEDFKSKMSESLESFNLYEQAAILDFTPAD